MNTNLANKQLVCKIDPRVKLVFIISVGGLINGATPEWYQLCLVLVAALICVNERMYRMAAQFVTFYLVIFAITEVIKQSNLTNPLVMTVMLICVILKWFAPGVLCAVSLIHSTTVSEIMSIADRMHIPYKIVIPMAVIVRYFPTLKEEWNNVKLAMKMRGIGMNIENVMVPIISASIRIGDELSAAALSRGLGYTEKRTNMYQAKMFITDYILLVIFVVNGIVIYGRLM